MASTRIFRTAGTPTNDKIWTISGWFKFHSNVGHVIFASDGNNNTSWTQSRWSSGRLELGSYSTLWLRTNRVFRDYNAWYHIMYVADSTQATASDRLKIYVNGVEETSFETDNRSSTTQNQSWGWNKNGAVNNIGGENASGYGNFTCSHFHNIDGTALTPSTFGEYDANGVWTINTSPTISSYGNNGFFWLKDTIATTDHSPNSNTFTIGGTLTNTEDCPDNVFATMNPLDGHISHMVFSHGNNTVDNGSTASLNSYATSTIGMSSGKFYFEAKNVTNANWQSMGISDRPSPDNTNSLGTNAYDYGYQNGDGAKLNNSSQTSYGNSYTTNDIIGCAVDLDNLKIYFSKNGVWQNSGDPESGATGTGAAFTITAPSLTSTGFYFFAVGDNTAANSSKWSANFGNGYFGTTAVASAGTNASGIGIFEYDVPNGYTALSTKGLNL
jgi:hypothetical protein